MNTLKQILLVCIFALAEHADAINLADLAVYNDQSLSATQRCQRLLDLLHVEVANPTKSFQGIGGPIDHDYTLAQIITALFQVADPSPDARNMLANRLPGETEEEAIEAIQIVLGQCGDATFKTKIESIVTSKRGKLAREEAADALRAIYRTPDPKDLLDKLTDEDTKSAVRELYSGKYGLK